MGQRLVSAATIVVATGNQGKVSEFNRLLADLPFSVRMQSEFNVLPAEETGATFIENAILKARAAAAQTGLPALADDSGIEVDALQGRPGVRSARYATANEAGDREDRDQANNDKLLRELSDVANEHRSARFHCVIVLLQHAEDPVPFIAHGTWEGKILPEPAGEGGFGYDPLFFDPKHGLSAAQMAPELKNKVSHRGQAVRKLLDHLQQAPG
ncbi:MAG: RdgB/HAM1 family non-canonical purine NTP pyrophosphatase [Pseudomonadota bacterium]